MKQINNWIVESTSLHVGDDGDGHENVEDDDEKN